MFQISSVPFLDAAILKQFRKLVNQVFCGLAVSQIYLKPFLLRFHKSKCRKSKKTLCSFNVPQLFYAIVFLYKFNLVLHACISNLGCKRQEGEQAYRENAKCLLQKNDLYLFFS